MEQNKLHIGVVTGTRAEYGLLSPLLHLLENDPGIALTLYVTGTHLSEAYGYTFKEIERDNYREIIKIDIRPASGSVSDVTGVMGRAVSLFGKSFESSRPDILVLLGDRYEIFEIAAAAAVARIPVAHLHGGELSEGAFDDAFRHSITKMAHLHFTSTEIYRKRVIQLGESPDRVFNTGALGVDNIRNLHLLTGNELEKELGIQFRGRVLLVTYHPETLSDISPEQSFAVLLEALDTVENKTIVFTYPNADRHGEKLIAMIQAFVAEHSSDAFAFASLGHLRYLSLLKLADVVVGNSSSGILEAPVLKTPTVNIGDRQDGRIRTLSIIDCMTEKTAIKKAIGLAVDPAFKKSFANMVLPYGDGYAAPRILELLKQYTSPDLLHKKFHDLP